MLKWCFIVVIGTAALCGCSQGNTMSNYVQVMQSGIMHLAWPKEMETLFGEGDHFITHYNRSSGPKLWNSVVFFGGRYVLSLQVPVEIDYSSNRVHRTAGSPKFYLNELEMISIDSNGLVSATISRQSVINEDKWSQLVKNRGDWAVIGIKVQTNAPLSEFSKYVQAQRKPRVRIPH